MRLVVISDLHIGHAQAATSPYDIFAGWDALPAFIAGLLADDHLVINGDAFDFLMDDGPLDVANATARATSLVAGPHGKSLLDALAGHIARGGEVTLRVGNHDLELLLPEVRSVLAASCAGLRFDTTAIQIVDVGGVRIAIAHGEQHDTWNRFRKPDGTFAYPPGSSLVKKWLNPAKAAGLRFLDMLMPYGEGAVLGAIAVRPSIVSLVPGGAAFLARYLVRQNVNPNAFAPPPVLSEEAEAALQAALQGAAAGGFTLPTPKAIRAEWLKVAFAGYSRVQRHLAGDAGERIFTLDATPEEFDVARNLAAEAQAPVVVTGHTHAARLTAAEEIVCANSGTWIGLMGVPTQDAPAKDWADLLSALEADPGLSKLETWAGRDRTRFDAVVVEPNAKGAAVSVRTWVGGALVTQRVVTA